MPAHLNRVECHFGPIAEFVVKNADYLDWDAFAHALSEHVRYRNGPHHNRRPRSETARPRPPDEHFHARSLL